MQTFKIAAALVAGMVLLAAAGPAAAGDFSISVRIGSQPVVQPVVGPIMHVANPATLLLNNQTATLTGQAGSATYFRILVPHGQTYLNVVTAGAYGDVDLYLARGYLPTTDAHDYVAGVEGTDEQISVLQPAAGEWYAMVYGYSDFRDVSLLASYWQQAVYYPTSVPGTVVVPPINTRVYIDWSSHGYGRSHGGLISFILHRLRDRSAVRHQVVHHRIEPVTRPHVVYRRSEPVVRRPAIVSRPTATVRPRIVRPAPPARTMPPVARRPAPTTVRPPAARTEPRSTAPRPGIRSRSSAPAAVPVTRAAPTVDRRPVLSRGSSSPSRSTSGLRSRPAPVRSAPPQPRRSVGSSPSRGAAPSRTAAAPTTRHGLVAGLRERLERAGR